MHAAEEEEVQVQVEAWDVKETTWLQWLSMEMERQSLREDRQTRW